jgi:hypothetical protein
LNIMRCSGFPKAKDRGLSIAGLAPISRLGNEIDKLAGNIVLGRDAAGVHYRSDSVRGLFAGEQQALGLLRDYSRAYNEDFDGFILRKFNGSRVRITKVRSGLSDKEARNVEAGRTLVDE